MLSKRAVLLPKPTIQGSKAFVFINGHPHHLLAISNMKDRNPVKQEFRGRLRCNLKSERRLVGWLFWVLRSFETIFQSISGRLPERGRKRREKIDGSKNAQTTPTRTHCKRRRPLPYYQPNQKDAPALEVYPAPSHHPTSPLKDEIKTEDKIRK